MVQLKDWFLVNMEGIKAKQLKDLLLYLHIKLNDNYNYRYQGISRELKYGGNTLLYFNLINRGIYYQRYCPDTCYSLEIMGYLGESNQPPNIVHHNQLYDLIPDYKSTIDNYLKIRGVKTVNDLYDFRKMRVVWRY